MRRTIYQDPVSTEVTGAFLDRDRISSVDRELDYGAGGRGFDSRGRTITLTQGLKMTEKWLDLPMA